MTRELVARLRAHAETQIDEDIKYIVVADALMREAADALEQSKAEIETLERKLARAAECASILGDEAEQNWERAEAAEALAARAREVVQSVETYLRDLHSNLLVNDADMYLDPCDSPELHADRLRSLHADLLALSTDKEPSHGK